jgi:lysophospholipase L1-like esterase
MATHTRISALVLAAAFACSGCASRRPAPVALGAPAVGPAAATTTAPAVTTAPTTQPKSKGRVMDAAEHYRERMEVFAAEQVRPGGIVLVGSSHFEGFNTAKWLPGRRIVNRGISSDRIGIGERGILRRLDVSVFDVQPRYIIFENGANDLGELWRHGTPSIPEIAACYEEVIAAIRRRLPDVPVLIVNVMPTCGAYAGLSPLVPPLNDQIERIASEYGCHYLDFYSVVADDDGELDSDATTDGLHLNEFGYRHLAERIEEFLTAELGKPDRD